MSEYAKNTRVSEQRSRNEIERILERYGVDGFAYAWDTIDGKRCQIVSFKRETRTIRFAMTIPSVEDFETTATGRWRSDSSQQTAWEQACRQRWRALALAIKAKLEMVESGIATFDDEFLPYMLLPGGMTVAETLLPQLDDLYETGETPKLLPG